MIERRYLNDVPLYDSDDYGTVLLRLVVDLLKTIDAAQEEEVIWEKGCLIVSLSCEAVRDALAEHYEWDEYETSYAEQVTDECVAAACASLLQIAYNPRITSHRSAHLMAYLMTLSERARSQIEDAFYEEHGAMNFFRSDGSD